MVHPTDTELAVPNAGRHTGAEHGGDVLSLVDRDVVLAWKNFCCVSITTFVVVPLDSGVPPESEIPPGAFGAHPLIITIDRMNRINEIVLFTCAS